MPLCNKRQRVLLVNGYIRNIKKCMKETIIPDAVISICLLYHKYTKYDVDRIMHLAPKFKIVIIGDVGVGKTTLSRYFLSDHNKERHKHSPYKTLSVEVNTVQFYTSHGPIKISCWDTTGQEKWGGLRDGYYVGANAAIILFDVTSRMSYKSTPHWYRDVTRVCGDIPIVL